MYKIILLFIIQILIFNPLEKIAIQLNYKTINRPHIDYYYQSFHCLGMPSGHAESITILMILSYLYNYINLH